MNKNLLIGSRALNYWFPEHKIKESTDWDIITYNDLPWAEVHDPDILLNHCFVKYTDTRFDLHCIEHEGETLHVVNPTGLAIIKRSHLWRDLSFEKHMMQYIRYLKVFRDKLTPWQETLLEARTEATMQMFPQGHPKLNQSVESFFDDAVTKKFSHDWLHELYAYYNEPLYKKLQKDYTSAWCSKELWDLLSEEDKVKCVAEEAYVIATERFLVPKEYKYSGKIAFNKAVNKICTTLCSGYFRNFAIDNYKKVLDSYEEEKVQSVIQILKGEKDAKYSKG